MNYKINQDGAYISTDGTVAVFRRGVHKNVEYWARVELKPYRFVGIYHTKRLALYPKEKT